MWFKLENGVLASSSISMQCDDCTNTYDLFFSIILRRCLAHTPKPSGVLVMCEVVCLHLRPEHVEKMLIMQVRMK